MLEQIATGICLIAASLAAIGAVVLVWVVVVFAAIELWDDRRRARREDDQ